MKYATLAQGQQVLKLIKESRVSAIRLQMLLETDLLPTLIGAHLDEIDKTKFRESLGLTHFYSVHVNFGVSSRQAFREYTGMKAGERYGAEIDSIHMEYIEGITAIVPMTTIRYHVAASREQVLNDMRAIDVRPATMLETIALASNESIKQPLVALGSGTNYSGIERWPTVYPEHQILMENSWRAIHKFAAVINKK